MSKESIDAYDAQAEDWAAYLRSGQNLAHRFVEKPAMYALLPELAGKSVLCAGCGTGEELEELARRDPERLVGIDLSSGMIEVARKHYPKQEFHVMDIGKLDFADGEFDLVYSSLTIHYVADWGPVLQEWSRVLKPGGEILLSTQHPAYMAASRSGEGRLGYSIRAGFSYFRPLKRLRTYGNYFQSGQSSRTHRTNQGTFQLITYRKTFSEMLAHIRQSGLELVDCVEPKPTAEAEQAQEKWVKMNLALPQFILFRLRKP